MKYFTLLLLSFVFIHSQDTKKNLPPRVVLIHGFMVHNSMDRFAFILRRNGWEVENYKYKSRAKTIEDHGADLVAKLHSMDLDERPIHFITFSLGGLVLKAALNNENCPQQVKKNKAVLIAPPINGSRVARRLGRIPYIRKVFGKHSGRQLCKDPESKFSGPPYYPECMDVLVISGTCGFNPVLSGKNDGKVSIEESCPHFPHAHKFVFAGHSWISKHILTLNLALDFLQKTKPYKKCTFRKNCSK